MPKNLQIRLIPSQSHAYAFPRPLGLGALKARKVTWYLVDSCCQKTVAVHLNSPQAALHSEIELLLRWVVQKTFLLENLGCSCSCVETLVILRAKFHIVSSLLSVLKNSDVDAMVQALLALRKWAWPENKTTVNLKSASFVAIMLFHKGLTHIHSQKKSLACILAQVLLWQHISNKSGSNKKVSQYFFWSWVLPLHFRALYKSKNTVTSVNLSGF